MSHLLVTGSIAYDRISVFKDHFGNHILPDKIHRLNVSFLVHDMTVNFGGTGGNIAYSLSLLEEKPLLLGAVGDDFDLYETALRQHGVNTNYLKRVSGTLTAHATIMTDLDDNQIASFYEGAGAHAGEASIESVAEKASLAIVSPNNLKAMLGYAASCRKKEIPFIADPGQMILAFSEKDLLAFIDGAAGLITNDYEWQLIRNKTALTENTVLEKVNWLVVTYGGKGAKVWTKKEQIDIPIVKAEKVVDPTGSGDAFRAGLMYGIKHKHSLEKSARIGAFMGAKAVEKAGTQNHAVNQAEWKQFLNHLK